MMTDGRRVTTEERRGGRRGRRGSREEEREEGRGRTWEEEDWITTDVEERRFFGRGRSIFC